MGDCVIGSGGAEGIIGGSPPNNVGAEGSSGAGGEGTLGK